MVGIRLSDRFGNHMFQYAFILNLAKKQNTQFFLDESRVKFLLVEFFELRSFNKTKNRFLLLLYKIIRKKTKKKVHHGENIQKNLLTLTDKNCKYVGYFQSELFFKENKELIKDNFKIKKKLLINVRSYFNLSKKPIIAVHIRRTDYINYGDERLGGINMTLPLSYYYNAFSKIENLDTYQIIYISDDIEFVKKNLKQKGLFISNSLIIDFQILLTAEIIITANSSFSWWAAYLSNAKRVLSPKYWLGFKINSEYPNSIIPKEWEKIDVY